MCFFFVFQIFVCVRVCIIINFINPFRQMPVNTRRQTAGLSPLIKVSKKNERKQFQNGRCSIIHQAGQTQTDCKKEFWVTPRFDKDTKAQGKRCIIGPFKQRSIYIL